MTEYRYFSSYAVNWQIGVDIYRFLEMTKSEKYFRGHSLKRYNYFQDSKRVIHVRGAFIVTKYHDNNKSYRRKKTVIIIEDFRDIHA